MFLSAYFWPMSPVSLTNSTTVNLVCFFISFIFSGGNKCRNADLNKRYNLIISGIFISLKRADRAFATLSYILFSRQQRQIILFGRSYLIKSSLMLLHLDVTKEEFFDST